MPRKFSILVGDLRGAFGSEVDGIANSITQHLFEFAAYLQPRVVLGGAEALCLDGFFMDSAPPFMKHIEAAKSSST